MATKQPPKQRNGIISGIEEAAVLGFRLR